MDFITCLPVTASGHDMLIVWVDRLTKYVILSPSKLTLNAEGFAQHTIDHVISKHGVPTEFVSDRDVRFTSSFWQSLTSSLNTKLSMSTAFHPQTDGQTERMNRLIEETLRHYVCYAQNDWDFNIQLVAFAINNAKNESIGASPFYLNKGLHPRMPCGISLFPSALEFSPRATSFSNSMHTTLATAKQCLVNARSKQKTQADKKRRDVVFVVQQSVLLCTKNLKIKGDSGTSLSQKLLPRFIGPYVISELVGKVAVKLLLPKGTKIHPVFHVSMIRPFVPPLLGSVFPQPPMPPDWLEGDPEFLLITLYLTVFSRSKRN